MKQSILTFLTVLIIFGSMSSSASDGMIQIAAHSESQAATVAADNPPAKEAASSTAMPGSAVILLIATGLVGLAGVSRRNNH
jgi:hypothetical protein